MKVERFFALNSTTVCDYTEMQKPNMVTQKMNHIASRRYETCCRPHAPKNVKKMDHTKYNHDCDLSTNKE